MIKIPKMHHGGIMTNYECNAACRHCLYACSPDRSSGYISPQGAEEVCRLLVEGGCRSVHIGGGEPFLNFDGLINLLETAKKFRISVEYVETNGFWAAEPEKAKQYLKALLKTGADTLCISLDPFHAEYVPYSLPLKLAELCRSVGFGYFLWQERFLRPMADVTPNKPHNRKALERQISPNYILETAQSYGIGMGGRAINIELEYNSKHPINKIISNQPCRGLLSTNHFHIDLHGNFIPPGCTGIAIPLGNLLNGLQEGKYPVFEALLTGGVANLLDFATKKGFTPDENYASNCALCFFIRKWLSENAECPELDVEHYTASFDFYD